MKILVASKRLLNNPHISNLKNIAKIECLENPNDEDELVEKIQDVDIFIGSFASERVIETATKLKLIQTTSVGYERINLNAVNKKGIILCNVVGSNAESVAELTWGLILGIARQIPGVDRIMREGKWERFAPEKHTILWGKTLGIIGFGSIGRQVALQARLAFNMELLISDPFVTPDEILNLGGKAVSLETLLKKSDFVSIHVPLMPSTRHLIGEKEIKMMKSTAFLINTARGAVIDESALIKCLNENIILGAALDVFEVEPLPVDSPLRSLENVVMVSHQGTAPEAGKRMVYVAVENVTRYLQGERPLYIQNPKVIYMNEERRET